MLKYLTGAAAIALAASAVMADPGGGKGGGAGNSGGGNPHAAHDGGKGGGKRGDNQDGGDKARGNGGGAPQVAQGNGNGNGNGRAANGGGNGKVDKASAPRGNSGRDRADRSERLVETRQATVNRGNRDDLSNWRWADAVPQRTRGLIAGCPPGLAKKGNGCLPPGLARKAGYAPVFYDSPNWWNFDDRWHDSGEWNGGDYRYHDGYLVRYGDGGIDSWLPLLGGALSPGNLWPSQYETQGLPSYYQDYYGVGQPDGYRYYDDTLYRVDPQSNAITAISALLTGDSLQVGQPLPLGYDVYNVPYSYRDRYPDGGESDYRYSDGSIYQVDTKTQIIQAVIGLLT